MNVVFSRSWGGSFLCAGFMEKERTRSGAWDNFSFGGFKRRPKMRPRDVWNRWAGRPQEVHVHDYLNSRMVNIVIVFPNASPLR